MYVGCGGKEGGIKHQRQDESTVNDIEAMCQERENKILLCERPSVFVLLF
jgi:hypothetical protein